MKFSISHSFRFFNQTVKLEKEQSPPHIIVFKNNFSAKSNYKDATTPKVNE